MDEFKVSDFFIDTLMNKIKEKFTSEGYYFSIDEDDEVEMLFLKFENDEFADIAEKLFIEKYIKYQRGPTQDLGHSRMIELLLSETDKI